MEQFDMGKPSTQAGKQSACIAFGIRSTILMKTAPAVFISAEGY